MVTTRGMAYANRNSNPTANSDDSQATITDPGTSSQEATVQTTLQTASQTATQTATTQAGPEKEKARLKKRRRRKDDLQYHQAGDYAAELRRQVKEDNRPIQPRCDRCRIHSDRCDQDPTGCAHCKKRGIKCTVTILRYGTTWVKGDNNVPKEIQAERQNLINQIEHLSNQINKLKSQLKYDTEAQALRDLHQENEQLRAETEWYRTISVSTTAAHLDTRSMFMGDDGKPVVNPMVMGAPFSSQQLDIGQNPYAPPLRASDKASTNPATLPNWAQPAMSMSGTNAFAGPAAPDAPTTLERAEILQNTTQHQGYLEPHVDPTLLDPAVGLGGQGHFPGNNVGNTNSNNNPSIIDRPAHAAPNGDDNFADVDDLFDVIMWDQ
ncbi:hypothetical protein BJY01DRAFT_248607 [Aspergillus pseudoustus]|uniref:Zn(2)-C6 fungal-type domain-containing protein n=1 Tax=Aspergillus pseudoustus TaxID=1810923 RepID=A0ABR4JUK2_9EURO